MDKKYIINLYKDGIPGKHLNYHTHPDKNPFSGRDIGVFLAVDMDISAVDTIDDIMYVMVKTKNTQKISIPYITGVSKKLNGRIRELYKIYLPLRKDKNKALYEAILKMNIETAEKYRYNFYVFDKNKGVIRKWIYGN